MAAFRGVLDDSRKAAGKPLSSFLGVDKPNSSPGGALVLWELSQRPEASVTTPPIHESLLFENEK
jgi:hypothetical protein